MSAQNLRNIELARYQRWLEREGLYIKRKNSSHVHYDGEPLRGKGPRRVFTLSINDDPVPQFIIRQHLQMLGLNREEFLKRYGGC